MDLRTIMNNDAGGGANNNPTPPPHSPAVHRSASESHYRNEQNETPSGPSYPAGLPGQPQPPPLQPPHRSPDRSSSYGSVQSPYQYSSTSKLTSGAPSQQGPVIHGSPSFASAPRDSFAGNLSSSVVYSNQQTPGPLVSPFTPQPMSAGIQQQQQQSYFSQRSQSIQENPQSAGAQPPLAPQQFSPQAQRSQPGTPLGPPSVSYQRPSPQSVRPASSGRDSQHAQLSSPWGAQENQTREQRNIASPTAHSRPSRQDSRSSEHTQKDGDKERSVSVSPKTVFASTPRQTSIAGSIERTSPSNRNSVDDGRQKESPTASASVHAQGGAGATSGTYQAVTPQQPYPASISNRTNSSPPARMNSSGDVPMTSSAQLPPKENMSMSPASVSGPPPAKRKRTRYAEPPIYARKAPGTHGRSPMLPARRPPVPKHARHTVDDPASRQKSIPPAAAIPAAARNQVNGAPPTNGRISNLPPPEPSPGLLGPWEPSITGLIPHEEITKLICDFLFQQVVMRKDVGAGPAGGAATGQDAILEVEAKLGQLIDRNRGERLRLPVLTECILSKDDPAIRTSFESSMSLAQHRAMNNFLNDAVKASMPQANSSRVPLSYAHKKERDTFYEVNVSELPPVIQHNLHPRHKPKVRVTRDQRTGEILAKIVKCRVADLDVYSPRTCVDWRISVNLEMNYDGDVSNLPIADGAGARGRAGGERNKDRMSYRHLAYQVDLTQVATAEPPTKSDFEHELEIEISSAEVRRQGDLALAGDPKNQYEDLIKGFVDNIRVLARAVPGA
ncbi:hypothetical protein DTO021D3_9005 [Paecilomyces variotii]|nr:hypothetical protein DTO032I3_4176 [Paecilomyces variotii]KAJ9274110.1 hypothetical protein DTO021D3_9005 [Paecilomyces variotii]KAJ9347022.1 hypothetical protein DTO027B6_589 [Paecilomyces variotii]KAJ9354796.1 hypothetical protein DTO027B9_4512 [Paecilomyces variotii]KAJ9393401.1 hypothetical protein DTO032I4_172 [Paecilomyces variotii]